MSTIEEKNIVDESSASSPVSIEENSPDDMRGDKILSVIIAVILFVSAILALVFHLNGLH